MDDLFGLIVVIIGIIAGIYSDKKKKERNQKKTAALNVPGGGRKNVPNAQVSYGGRAGRTDSLTDAANAMQRELSVKQQELKQRLQQKYGSAAVNTAKPAQAVRRPVTAPVKDDILSRADSNVNEKQTDELREQFYEKTGEPPKKVHGECEEECSLMDEVSDLMIMGYQADLSFERDFVAEGVEMLNRFELPDEIVGLTEVHTA